jgi:ribonuclease BN (tRNA processing enzyme)
VRLTIVGCSPAWPNPGGAQSGYLLEGPARLLLDCGPGVLAKLRQESPWPELDAIVISHFHLDHWGDLVPWVWGSRYGPGRDLPPVELHVPPGGRTFLASLAGQFGGGPDMFDQAFAIHEYAVGTANEIAGFEVVPHPMRHYSIDTYGFRVSDGRATLAYSADSAPDGGLVELARDADLFLCEATLAVWEPEPRGHLSLAEAESAFAESGARRLLVTHRPRELPVTDGVELAQDGLELEL